MSTNRKSLYANVFYICALVLLYSTNFSCINRAKEISPSYTYDDAEIVIKDSWELMRKIIENLVEVDDNPTIVGYDLYYKSREEIYKTLGKYGFSEKTTNQEMESFLNHIKEGDYSGEIFTYDVVTSAKSDIYICQRVNYIFVLMIFKEANDDISLFGFIRDDRPGVTIRWQKTWSNYMNIFY